MSRKTRKLIWSAPLLAIFAVAAALAIFAAQPPDPAQAHGLPGVVKNLKATVVGTDQIDLSWDAVSTATSYRIDRSKNGNTWMSHVTGHTMLTYSDTGLDHSTPYYYRVFAVNSAGTGPVSQDFTVQTNVPTAPGGVTGLTATAMGQNVVKLEWNAPAKTGGLPITKYSFHWQTEANEVPVRTTPATDPQVFEVAAADGTTYYHRKLTANTRYKYIVYAHNAATGGTAPAGKSTTPSDLAAAKTSPLVAPGAPSAVQAVQTGGTGTDAKPFNLYWRAPTNNGGTAPIGYQVQAAYTGGSPARTSAFANVETTWRNTASTADPNGQQASADTTFSVPGEFDHDGNDQTTAVAVDKVQFRVYTITRNDDDQTANVNEQLISSGYGQSSIVTIFTADDARMSAIPDAPTFVNDNAKRDGKGNVNLQWTAPSTIGGDNEPKSIGGYRVEVSDDGLQWRGLPDGDHTRKTSPKFQYLDPDKKNRFYRVFSWHAQYLGPAQTTIVVSSLTDETITLPSHVKSFTATPAGPSQIDLSWSKPDSDGNADIAAYRIDGAKMSSTGTFVDFPPVATEPVNALPTAVNTATALTAVSKTAGYSHMKLMAGDTWKYRVLAITDSGATTANYRTSAAASAETRTATTTQAPVPEAPVGLTAEDAKSSSATGTTNRGVLLQWNAPNPPDGAAIDGYKVQRKKRAADSTDAWSAISWETLVDDSNSVDTDYTDETVPADGEMRQYQVAALNGTVMGPYSATVTYPAMHTAATAHVMPSGTIMDQTVVEGMSLAAMDVSGYFDVTEGITYSAMSDMEMYATADIPAGSNMLTITGVAMGSATITVTADDGAATAMQTFMVTVTAANAAPVPATDPGDMLPETVSLTVGDDDEVITLTDSFTDPDGDTVMYEATSDMPMYATAMVDDMNMLTIAAVAAGSTTVTVTASDGMGGTATHDIAVTVTAALMAPTNVTPDPVGSGILIVRWDAVAGAAGYYVIAVAPGDRTDNGTAVLNYPPGARLEAAVRGLNPGQAYTVFVTAFGGGQTASSAFQTVTTDE